LQDKDRTLTYYTDLDLNPDNDTIISDKINLESLVPLSNPGNIEVEVSCHLTYDDALPTQQEMDTIYFSEGCHLRIVENLISLEPGSRLKNCVKLVLQRNTNTVCHLAQNVVGSIENVRVKMILQIKPNGQKSVIPVNILVKKHTVPALANKQQEQIIKESSMHSQGQKNG
jgi:hypothetical protein